jgi:predicted MFS family arabinose efflux permease
MLGNTSDVFVVTLALLLVRGILETIMKSSTTIAVRRYVGQSHLEHAISLFDTSRYVAGGLGGLVGGLLITFLSIREIAVIDAATFLLAAGCVRLIKYTGVETLSSSRGAGRQVRSSLWSVLRRKESLLGDLVRLTIVTALFQGYHSAARTALPLAHLNAGNTAVGLLQAAASAAFIAGALISARFFSGAKAWKVNDNALTTLTTLAMWIPLATHNLVAVLCGYFAFLAIYEILFIQITKRLILDCPEEALSSVASARSAWGTAGMVVVTAACGYGFDSIGFTRTTMLIGSLGLMCVLVEILPESRR